MDNKKKLFRERPGRNNKKLKTSLLSTMILIALLPSTAQATESDSQNNSSAFTDFDVDFLKNTPGSTIDITRFQQGIPLESGSYRTDIYINNKLISRESVEIRHSEGKSRACIQKNVLALMNFKADAVNAESAARLSQPEACVTLEELVPTAKAVFDSGDLRLDVYVPQASLTRKARGTVDPSLWEVGENALFVGYNTNVYQSENRGIQSQSFYGSSNVGLNLQGWMFRHNGALRWQNDTRRHYTSLQTYVQHDITPLKAMLTLGDSNTTGELFDTFAFRGVRLATDERMLPDTQRGYAPVVRGNAVTNAHVTISQNGVTLYDTTVPPGEFVIDDLYPTGYGGDLDVVVEEANGQVNRFSVPYASVAQLLRPGTSNYSLVAGILRNHAYSFTPNVIQGTLQHGLSNGLTGYTGLLSTGEYNAGLLGVAWGMPIGALALDVTGSRASSHGLQRQGASYRVTYSKLFITTRSNLSIAAYRFSSSGYLDLDNAMRFSDYARHPGVSSLALQRPRNRLSITASQGLSEGSGQFYISGYSQNYWDREGTDKQFQIGYSNNIGQISYNLSANRVSQTYSGPETQYQLSFSVPLGGSQQAPNLNLYAIHGKQGITSQTSVNGLLGENNQFSYNVGMTRDVDNSYSSNVSTVYRTPYTSLQGSLTKGENFYSASAGVSGAVVALSDSITASPYNTSTMAIINAPDAGGATVEGYSGVVLNGSGNAVVPYLNPYRINTVSLNPAGLSADIELETTSQRVIPRAGAVVKLNYPTSSGRAALIRAVMLDGEPLPFGAPVTDKSGQVVGTVTQGGQIFARLSSNSDRLNVKWGEDGEMNCTFNITLPERDKKDPGQFYFERVNSQCDALN